MTDLEKLYQLALNIVNYPYNKAVFWKDGKIKRVVVYPYENSIRSLALDNIKPIKLFWDWNIFHGCNVVTEDDFRFFNDLIKDLKNNDNKKAKEALLDGIE